MIYYDATYHSIRITLLYDVTNTDSLPRDNFHYDVIYLLYCDVIAQLLVPPPPPPFFFTLFLVYTRTVIHPRFVFSGWYYRLSLDILI